MGGDKHQTTENCRTNFLTAAVPKLFLGRPRPEFGGHSAIQDANIVLKKILTVKVRIQSQQSTHFSITYTLQKGTDKQVALKIYNSVLDRLSATHF